MSDTTPMFFAHKSVNTTYATAENAIKAVDEHGFSDLRFIVAVNSRGRYFPVFIGEAAVREGVHFYFPVAG